MRKKKIRYKVNANGCHICTSHPQTGGGYIVFRRCGKRYSLHRYIFEQVHSKIPEGLVVRHTCDTPQCINPDHLILGTQLENIRDQYKRGENSKVGNSKLTIGEVREIKKLNGLQREIAKMYNIHQVTVSQIKTGTNWKNVE